MHSFNNLGHVSFGHWGLPKHKGWVVHGIYCKNNSNSTKKTTVFSFFVGSPVRNLIKAPINKAVLGTTSIIYNLSSKHEASHLDRCGLYRPLRGYPRPIFANSEVPLRRLWLLGKMLQSAFKPFYGCWICPTLPIHQPNSSWTRLERGPKFRSFGRPLPAQLPIILTSKELDEIGSIWAQFWTTLQPYCHCWTSYLGIFLVVSTSF